MRTKSGIQPKDMHGLLWLKPAELAQKMGVTVGQLRRLAAAKEIPGQRRTSGGQLRWLMSRATLARFLDRRLQRKADVSLKPTAVRTLRAAVFKKRARGAMRREVNAESVRAWALDQRSGAETMTLAEKVYVFTTLAPVLQLGMELADDLSARFPNLGPAAVSLALANALAAPVAGSRVRPAAEV